MHDPVSKTGATPLPAELVAAAARCWRRARDLGAPVQQRLHEVLARRGQDMLAPVFDSFIALCEAALGRRIVVGEAAALSADEAMLVGMLDGSRRCDVAKGCPDGTASALASAVGSMRVMLALGRRRGMAAD